MTPNSARIVLDVTRGADPVAGHVRAGRRTPVAFTGWTALFSALREALAEPAAAGDDRADRPASAPST